MSDTIHRNWTHYTLAEHLLNTPDLTDSPDDEAAAVLASEEQRELRDIPTREVKSVLMGSGDWGRLRTVARMQPTDETQERIALATNAVDTVEGLDKLYVSSPGALGRVVNLVNALRTTNLISADTHAQLMALPYHRVKVWLPAPTPQDVASARNILKEVQ
jgi:hypothetical protein